MNSRKIYNFAVQINYYTINMAKKIAFLMAFALSIFCMGVNAQTRGYYRLQNVATGHVTHLAGMTQFAPNASLDEAHALPGTVAYLDFENTKITALSSQNIDVVNEVIPMLKMLVLQTIDEPMYYSLRDSAVLYVTSFMAAAVADLAVPLIKKFTYEDFQEYVYNTDTYIYTESAGDDTKYLYVNLPKFPLNAGVLTSYLVGKVNEFLKMLRTPLKNMAGKYLVGREYLTPTVNSLIEHFYFEDKIYLTEINDVNYGPQFGFVNSDGYQDESVRDKWTFLPVDGADNYFGVNGQVSDAEGLWYAAVSWAFPVTLSSGMKAYYVEDVLDFGKSQIKRHEITDEVIPAMTPMVIQLNGETAADNKVTLVLEEATNVIDGNVLHCATDSLGTLLGFDIPRTDPHFYVLGVKEGKIGLVEASQTHFDANTAYYYLNDSYKQQNPSGFLEMADEVSAINSIKTTGIHDGHFYDLQGRRVQNPTKGIYIVNGKKMVLR